MSITIYRQPVEENLVDITDYEDCIFCNEETIYWHEKSNRPVCPVCSVKYNVKDIQSAPFNYQA